MQSTNDRYTTIAILLHWVMAIAFILMLCSGFSMTSLPLVKSLKFALYQWHKSMGVLLLMAFFLRIGWRLFHLPPPLPATIKQWEQKAAKIGHRALYACMLLMPLSGWTIVSASVFGLPTIVFGLFQWPHIPGIGGNDAVKDIAEEIHEIIAFAFLFLIGGHVGAVIKHAVMERENLLTRMWWGSK